MFASDMASLLILIAFSYRIKIRKSLSVYNTLNYPLPILEPHIFNIIIMQWKVYRIYSEFRMSILKV